MLRKYLGLQPTLQLQERVEKQLPVKSIFRTADNLSETIDLLHPSFSRLVLVILLFQQEGLKYTNIYQLIYHILNTITNILEKLVI